MAKFLLEIPQEDLQGITGSSPMRRMKALRSILSSPMSFEIPGTPSRLMRRRKSLFGDSGFVQGFPRQGGRIPTVSGSFPVGAGAFDSPSMRRIVRVSRVRSPLRLKRRIPIVSAVPGYTAPFPIVGVLPATFGGIPPDLKDAMIYFFGGYQ